MNAGLLSTNEATALNLPTIPPSPERWLSGDELDAIRAVLAESYLFTFELLVGTGTRWGEAVGLHYDDVDLHRKTIRIRWAWDRRNHLMKSPKTRQTRTVPISDRLANLIQERLDADGLGTPPDVEYQGGRRPLYGLVLRGTNGLPVNPTSFAHGLTAAGNAAFVGAEGRKDRRRVGAVRTHDLRHSWASSLVQKGVPIDTVSKLLGHSNLTTTQRYADAADSQWDAVRNALG
ncbi:site-specific integrase [Gordonia otitidis]|nr:site-specific integrase [Gordonia otitidis]